MKQTLKNNLLTVEIDSHGAELHSIVNNISGQEYLWQADKAFWGRRSPVLFPLVGSVWNGVFRMDGKEFALGQHGFARDCEFELMPDAPEDEAWFALESNEETLKLYPRRFRLEIGYRLTGERLEVMWRVINLDEQPMCFHIGAHPAFYMPDFSASDPVHGHFMFGARDLQVQRIAEKGCVGTDEYPLELDSDGLLPVKADTFAHDALILADSRVRRVSLLTKDRRPYLSLFFSSPLVGLWSPKPDCPFVCIEPWWGRCDRVGFTGDFAQREYTNTLQPGQRFDAGYMMIFENV